jgi:glycolate oxidase FAD binding subunit
VNTALSSASASAVASRTLARIVGDDYIVSDPAQLDALAIDGVIPGAAVMPGSIEEVAAVVRVAAESGFVIAPAGGFTEQSIGGAPERVDILLRTDRLAAIEHYDPGDLTLSVGAGLTLAALDATLAANAQMLPVDVLRPDRATIGGVLATAAHGPMKHGYGGIRDYCIGIQCVTADGKLVKGGGRVVKNVAGYDLMKLMIGSFGTLGIIVRANFKVVPRPRQTRTFVCEFPSAEEALRFRDTVLASPLTPMCLEIVSPHAREFLRDAPVARDPDSMQPSAVPAPVHWGVMVRASGSDAVLARYARELGNAVTHSFDGDSEAQMWLHVSNFSANVMDRHRNAMIVHIGVPIAEVATALRAVDKAAFDYTFVSAVIGRVGIGSLVAAFVPLAVDPPSAMHYANAASGLRAGLPRDSSAIVTQCPLEAKRHFSVWGLPTADVQSMTAVKHALDPNNIFNRGRFVIG